MSKEQSTITIHIVAIDAKAVAQSFMKWFKNHSDQGYWNPADAQEFDAGINTTFEYNDSAQEITIRDIE